MEKSNKIYKKHIFANRSQKMLDLNKYLNNIGQAHFLDDDYCSLCGLVMQKIICDFGREILITINNIEKINKEYKCLTEDEYIIKTILV